MNDSNRLQRWRRWRWAFAAVAILASASTGHAAFAVPDSARAEAAYDGREPRVAATLLVHPHDRASNRLLRVAVLFDLDPGWHLYWRSPGESGLPTELRFTVDEGEVGPVAWPAPSVFSEAGGMFTTYGYEDRVLLAAEASFQQTRQRRHIRVAADFLVCRTECIPASLTLSRTWIDPSPGALSDASQDVRALFAHFAERVPVAPDSLGVALAPLYSQSAIRPGDEFRGAISVSSCTGTQPESPCEVYASPTGSHPFILDTNESIEFELTGQRPHPSDDRAYLLTFSGRALDDPGVDQRLSGVMVLEGPRGETRHIEVDLPLARARAGDPVTFLASHWLEPASETVELTGPQAPGLAGFARAILFGLLGGLLLNLMPCVLPVLAIKLFALTDLAQRSRREILSHAFAYAAGILVTMAAFALSVIALRAAGRAVGWGFQFQEPLFVAAISAVLVIFAANLFGVFEFRLSVGRLGDVTDHAGGARRSFFEGLLAVVLATPCSAPFLGTAAGFAFASSAPFTIAIFLAIGLGLAAPFVLVALIPRWRGIVPRSGEWMLELRAGLAFCLLATVVWLLWVVGLSVAPEGLVALVAFLLVVAFGTWLYGLTQTHRPQSTAAVGVLFAVIALGMLNTIELRPVAREDRRAVAQEGAARPFDRADVTAALSAGRPVFVYFTADWCITCKVSERLVIEDDGVQEQLEALDVAVFVADWTRRDERIRAELARFGRAGVPFYLVYAPSNPDEPSLMAELLTAGDLIAALREAGPKS